MTFHQLFIVVGVLVGQIIGVPWLLGQHEYVPVFITMHIEVTRLFCAIASGIGVWLGLDYFL